jgi:hypothetical protein
MKLDWSKILIIGMALFVIFIVSMGIKMATSNQSLYEKDYYEQGEMHAERMVQEQEGAKVMVSFNRGENAIDVKYEQEGYVTGYRLVFLADSKYDFDEKSTTSTPVKAQTLKIPRALKAGIWVLEITGFTEGEAFFKKQQIVK